jgi:hypothetical protein
VLCLIAIQREGIRRTGGAIASADIGARKYIFLLLELQSYPDIGASYDLHRSSPELENLQEHEELLVNYSPRNDFHVVWDACYCVRPTFSLAGTSLIVSR